MSLRTAMRVVREYATTQIALEPHYHGTYLSVDRPMRGRARFCKKLGTNDVTITSAQTMILAGDLNAGALTLSTRNKVEGTVSGTLFKMPDTYLVRLMSPVQRISSQGSYWEWEIDTSTPITTSYPSGSVVTVYGHPADVLVSDAGSVQVRSTADIVAGDVILTVHDTDAGFVEGKAVELLTVGDKTTIPAAQPIFSYPATIDNGLVSHLSGVMTYVRADSAYTSSLIPATRINGVFFLDCVSGTTLGDDPEDVAITLRVHGSDYSVVRSYSDVKKNTAVALGATPASDLATGSVDRGRLVPMFDGSLYSVNDTEGLCGFGYDFVQSIQTGLKLSAVGPTGTKI